MVGLKSLLVFVTGLDELPVWGFSPSPAVEFRHPQDLVQENKHLEGLVSANTCCLELTLPVVKYYDVFKDNFVRCLEHLTTFTTA